MKESIEQLVQELEKRQLKLKYIKDDEHNQVRCEELRLVVLRLKHIVDM